MTCSLCGAPATTATAYVEHKSFMVCPTHFKLWYTTREDISLWAWCNRIINGLPGRREFGRTWFCDWMDSLAVST